MRIDVPATLAALASLVVVVGGIAGALLWFRKWVRSQVAQPVQAAAEQLKTSNGTTVAGYVEHINEKMDDLGKRLGTLAEGQAQNLAIAVEGRALAKSAHERLDDHLLGHGKPDGGVHSGP